MNQNLPYLVFKWRINTKLSGVTAFSQGEYRPQANLAESASDSGHCPDADVPVPGFSRGYPPGCPEELPFVGTRAALRR